MDGIERMGSLTLRMSRLSVYLVWTLLLMPVQAIGVMLGCRWMATFPRFYHRRCCRILGLRVRRVGHPASGRPVLFASNHVSYLDITVLGSLLPASFIAKREVAGWPLFGWLARLQRSVFIDRQVRSTARQRDSIARRLADKEALILFPEGTSGDGNRVLPFKSALFSVAAGGSSAAPAAPVLVQPVSIAYTRLDGLPIGRRLRPLFAWYGSMALAPHLWTMLGLGTVEIVVEFHRPTTLAECGSRKALARYCEERVASGLASALSGRRRLPRDVRRPRRKGRPPSPAADAPAPALG
ncbi:MAG TPA: lysophospholipid acyltransferase family protein [Stellaceae bacterium]|jgi:1-acyl-sn-glycerol-3-phosphate acyltransferase|nr:lysophospholipid acyltransferase family protein [Stellaceae bacterium]